MEEQAGAKPVHHTTPTCVDRRGAAGAVWRRREGAWSVTDRGVCSSIGLTGDAENERSDRVVRCKNVKSLYRTLETNVTNTVLLYTNCI